MNLGEAVNREIDRNRVVRPGVRSPFEFKVDITPQGRSYTSGRFSSNERCETSNVLLGDLLR
jgi:hypothetical protein